MKDQDVNVRSCAAKALGQVAGPAAKQAMLVLIQSLKDENKDIRQLAAEALGKVGPEGQQELLRKNTVWVLEEIGLVTKQAVPSLIQGLEDYDSDVRKSVVDEIQKIDAKIEAETTDETSFDF